MTSRLKKCCDEKTETDPFYPDNSDEYEVRYDF